MEASTRHCVHGEETGEGYNDRNYTVLLDQGQQPLWHRAGLSLGDSRHVRWQTQWSLQDCKSQKPDTELQCGRGLRVFFFFLSDFDCALILSSWSKESIELIFLFYRSPRLTKFELL